MFKKSTLYTPCTLLFFIASSSALPALAGDNDYTTENAIKITKHSKDVLRYEFDTNSVKMVSFSLNKENPDEKVYVAVPQKQTWWEWLIGRKQRYSYEQKTLKEARQICRGKNDFDSKFLTTSLVVLQTNNSEKKGSDLLFWLKDKTTSETREQIERKIKTRKDEVDKYYENFINTVKKNKTIESLDNIFDGFTKESDSDFTSLAYAVDAYTKKKILYSNTTPKNNYKTIRTTFDVIYIAKIDKDNNQEYKFALSKTTFKQIENNQKKVPQEHLQALCNTLKPNAYTIPAL